jgi:hypothetical protein
MKLLHYNNRIALMVLVAIVVCALFLGTRRLQQAQPIKCALVQNTELPVNTVKALPEVKQYIEGFKSKSTQPVIEIDNPDDKIGDVWSVHVYENVKDTSTAHTATFNWYRVDKCTGTIKCSFSKYDSDGKYMGNSTEAEYPCQ